MYVYVIKDGILYSYLENSEKVIWAGKFKEIDVVSFLKMPNSDDCIIILRWIHSSNKPGTKNAMRVTPFGEIVWEIDLPNEYKNIFGINREDDIYVRIYKIFDTKVLINSYSGFLDDVDLETGKVVDTKFVK